MAFSVWINLDFPDDPRFKLLAGPDYFVAVGVYMSLLIDTPDSARLYNECPDQIVALKKAGLLTNDGVLVTDGIAVYEDPNAGMH